MVYTETTNKSYFSRIWDSIKWIFIWFILIIISIWLLWWNEWRTIKVSQWLAEWKEITVNWNISPIDKNLEWKLVYINWKADTNEILTDEIFSISKNAIKLIRKVEMYQWKENKKTTKKDNLWWSETTTNTYTYEKEWSINKISSSNFKESWHNNPTDWPFKENIIIAKKVKVWDIQLSWSFINQLDKKNNVFINDNDLKSFIKNNNITNAKNENGIIYIWNWTINNPSVWDIKISFSIVSPSEVSVIWLQKWESLVSYNTKTDTQINLIEYWNIWMEEMYSNAEQNNKYLAWLFRILWLAWMFIWFKLLFWVIVIAWKIVPFLSSILSVWTWIVSFILTLIFWWWIIIISWLFYRPILSLSILIIITLVIFLIKKYKINNVNIIKES